MKALGENVPGYQIRDMIREVDIDENGTVEFGEFLEVHMLVHVHSYVCRLRTLSSVVVLLIKNVGVYNVYMFATVDMVFMWELKAHE